jgi:hypothetical protein
MSDQMTITFEGLCVGAKTLTSKAGKDYSVLTFERQDRYKDTVTTQQFEATAFGERANVAHIGDVVNVALRVGARMGKDRYWPNFTVVSATKLASLPGAVTTDQTGAANDGQAESTDLPF